jgi:hypothetical protein
MRDDQANNNSFDVRKHDIPASTSTLRKKSEGVDDFLINFKHHQSSIQDFLSCLDKSEVAHEGIAVLSNVQNLTAKSSAQSGYSDIQVSSPSHSEVVGIDSERLNLESKAVLQRHEGQQPKSRVGQSGDSKLGNAHQSKRLLHPTQDMTEKEKDERRRFQNREAQRRFRERRMLDEYRRMSFSVPGKLLEWPTPKTSSNF